MTTIPLEKKEIKGITLSTLLTIATIVCPIVWMIFVGYTNVVNKIDTYTNEARLRDTVSRIYMDEVKTQVSQHEILLHQHDSQIKDLQQKTYSINQHR